MNQIEEYYRKEYNNLIKRVKNRAGSIENAEDVVQEAFCRAIQYIGTYDPRGEFGAWFNSILENTLKDYKSAERVGGMVVTNYIEDGIEENIHDEIVDHYLPEIKNLKPVHQKIMRMYFRLGHTAREISNILGISIRTVEDAILDFKKKIKAND